MTRRVWMSGLPLLLSGLILLLMINQRLDAPIIDLVLDERVLIVLVGVLLSAVLTINLYTQSWMRHVHSQSFERAREETAAEHRRFLGRLDHELKNPLMAIQVGLANLDGTTDPAQRRQIRTHLEAQITRLSHLVSDLRKVADIGTYPLEWTRIDVAHLLDEARAVASESEMGAGRTITLQLPPREITIEGDPDLLALALHNVISNALKFSAPSQPVHLCGAVRGAHAVLEVSDHGIGIPAAELDELGKELYRGASAHGIPGSGIGLSLVRTILERHNGQLDIRSVVGQGTTVSLLLPLLRSG